jgi:hypothetical protein
MITVVGGTLAAMGIVVVVSPAAGPKGAREASGTGVGTKVGYAVEAGDDARAADMIE